MKLLPAKGCAFVRFVELDAAIQAYNSMSGANIHGQTIRVGWGKVIYIFLKIFKFLKRLNQLSKKMIKLVHLLVEIYG